MKLIFALLLGLVHAVFVASLKVAVLGASGYTGAELTRILLNHPHAQLEVLTAERSAGQEFKSIFPQFAFRKNLPKLTRVEDSYSQIENCDVAFCCLPHGTTQEIIAKLAKSNVKIVDLSADFRLRDTAEYEQWYGKRHAAPELQKDAVYGLCEWNREKIKASRLVANPGCYPTAAQLPLIPLLRSKLISPEDIIIDAKSGTTGAGRAPKEAFLFCEVTDGIHAYGVGQHRHSPEIEQGLTDALSNGNRVTVNFTPHLMPMSRGILETIYVKMVNGVSVDDLKHTLQQRYADEPFVTVLDGGALPQTRHVRGSNHCFLNVVKDRIPGRAVIVSAIDNLVKGASGQAVQNMNILFGYDETTGLMQAPMFP